MGCATSFDGFEVVQDKELKEYLGEVDIKLVQESWFQLQDNLDQFGLILFERLFSQQRQLKRLFTTLIKRKNSGEVILDEFLLRAHVKVVMNALGAAVECLDDSAQLTTFLVGIGERHAMYGVKPGMIPENLEWETIRTVILPPCSVVSGRCFVTCHLQCHNYSVPHVEHHKIQMNKHFWPAVAYALEQTMDQSYTCSVVQSWKLVFNYIGSKVMEGISKWNIPDS